MTVRDASPRRHGGVLLLVWCALVAASGGAVPARAQTSPTAIIQRIRSTGNRPIDFHAAAFPDSVYVGQQVTYQVAVLLSAQARGRLRRNPEFLPPELRGLLAYDLGMPTRVPAREYGGTLSYEAHVFQRALFGVTAGAIRVPSPLLTYSLPQSASYFSRDERFVVRAESAQLVVKPLPVEGRPADYTGAVGVLRASARLDASTARVGDPLVLTVRIAGTGNVRLFPRPSVEVSWATVVAGNERIQVDTSGALVRGFKEFDFLLTPTRNGATTLPVLRYPYFDPYRGAYAVAETAPADVRVAAGDLAGSADERPTEQLVLRPWRHRSLSTIGELPPGMRFGAGALLCLAPLPALVALFVRRRRKRIHHVAEPSPISRRGDTPDDESPGGRARRARQTALATLAARLDVAPTDLVARRDVERVLRLRGVTRATTAAVLTLLDDLARAGFGPQSGAAGESVSLESRTRQLLDAVDREAVMQGVTRLWRRRVARTGALSALIMAWTIVWWFIPVSARAQTADGALTPAAVTCNTGAAGAGQSSAGASVTPSPLELLVGEATAAYAARRYASASQRFAAAVTACPRDIDLLVNWGTAAWAANDTVSAVIAWQRAARRDPLAVDVQERMALLPGGARGGFAAVPMVPVFLFAAGAAGMWCVGWALLLASWRGTARRRAMESSALALLLAGVAVGAAAWWGARALEGSALAVIRRPEPLRAAPGFEAATVGGVTTGDVVRMSPAQEGWSRVTLADGRDGWLPASRLAPLVAGTPIR